MAGKFIISKAKDGEFFFNLKASNGEIILTATDSYKTMEDCEKGIEAVKKNALSAVEDQTRSESVALPKYELYQDKAGEFRFRLKAPDGDIIGKSESYKAKASAKKGIASIGKNAPDAAVVVVEAGN